MSRERSSIPGKVESMFPTIPEPYDSLRRKVLKRIDDAARDDSYRSKPHGVMRIRQFENVTVEEKHNTGIALGLEMQRTIYASLNHGFPLIPYTGSPITLQPTEIDVDQDSSPLLQLTRSTRAYDCHLAILGNATVDPEEDGHIDIHRAAVVSVNAHHSPHSPLGADATSVLLFVDFTTKSILGPSGFPASFAEMGIMREVLTHMRHNISHRPLPSHH